MPSSTSWLAWLLMSGSYSHWFQWRSWVAGTFTTHHSNTNGQLTKASPLCRRGLCAQSLVALCSAACYFVSSSFSFSLSLSLSLSPYYFSSQCPRVHRKKAHTYTKPIIVVVVAVYPLIVARSFCVKDSTHLAAVLYTQTRITYWITKILTIEYVTTHTHTHILAPD